MYGIRISCVIDYLEAGNKQINLKLVLSVKRKVKWEETYNYNMIITTVTNDRLCSEGIQRFISPSDAHFHLCNLIKRIPHNIKIQRTTFIQRGKIPNEDVGYRKKVFKHVQALN